MRNQHTQQHQSEEKVVVQRDRCKFKSSDHKFFAQVKAKEVQRVNLIDALGTIGDVLGVVQVV